LAEASRACLKHFPLRPSRLLCAFAIKEGLLNRKGAKVVAEVAKKLLAVGFGLGGDSLAELRPAGRAA
jgi:hypothetical protein